MNTAEQKTVQMLIQAGVLLQPDKRHFAEKLDSVLIHCADGTKIRRTEQMRDSMYDEDALQDLHPHTHTRHGAGLMLVHESPIVSHGSTADKDLMRDIRVSVSMGYSSIMLIHHLPCKMARFHHIGPLEVIGSMVEIKHRIKQANNHVTVACFVQVTFPGMKEGLYFMSIHNYEAWAKNQE